MESILLRDMNKIEVKMMTKKKLHETKQLQEVNNNLKMNVNEATVIKALTKA